MSIRFVALPVGQGDAFLLESAGFRGLVDGGRSGRGLRQLLATQSTQHLDVAVCTHNDADHAGGLIGLLKHHPRSIRVREVWLPGSWTTRLRELLSYPEAFLYELAEQVAIAEITPDSTLESFADSSVADRERMPTTEEESIAEVLDGAIEDISSRRYASLRRIAGPFPWWPLRGPAATRIFLEAIDAAERIRQLAFLAWRRAAVVRWFDVDQASAGGTAPLLPINAREIARRPPRVPVLAFLALTVANRRSLCFQFVPSTGNAPVVLTADSDLATVSSKPWTAGSVVTAPHHGSEANARAYQMLGRLAGSVFWVRSDGRFRSRPGHTYLSQPQRFCTRCRPYTGSAIAQVFFLSGATWTPATASCSCR